MRSRAEPQPSAIRSHKRTDRCRPLGGQSDGSTIDHRLGFYGSFSNFLSGSSSQIARARAGGWVHRISHRIILIDIRMWSSSRRRAGVPCSDPTRFNR